MARRADKASSSKESNRRIREFIHETMRVRGWNYSELARAVGTDGSVAVKRDRIPSPKMTR
jgi:hypothetical protein